MKVLKKCRMLPLEHSNWSWKTFFGLFESDRFTQGLLYIQSTLENFCHGSKHYEPWIDLGSKCLQYSLSKYTIMGESDYSWIQDFEADFP